MMSELPVGDGARVNNQPVTVDDLDEDTDSPVEDDDQDTASGLDDEHEENNSASVERATVPSATTSLAVQKGNDDDDFRPVKKRKVQESNDGGEADEGQVCSICLEPWSNSGAHRIASLKCGHLFGLSCVEKWLKGSGGKCPQCNAKAKKGHVRIIYAKAISVVDTTERDQALKELSEEKSKTLSLQKESAQAILQCQLAQAECSRLQQKVAELQKQIKEGIGSCDNLTGNLSGSVTDDNGKYVYLKNIEITPQGGARVITYDHTLGMLVASKPSTNQLFPAYGLVKISALDLRVSEFIGIHKATLRDASFSPQSQGVVLTVATDKLAKLTSLQSNCTVQSYQTSTPIWSCCWSQSDPNYFYCGMQNGSVGVFDIRNTSSDVTTMKQEHSLCPITSLCHIPHSRVTNFGCEGVLAGTLEGVVFWEKKLEKFIPHGLVMLDGSCTSVTFEPLTRHCLASFRPSKRHPHCRHIMCQLHSTVTEAGNNAIGCRVVQQFTGGHKCKLLSRSSLFVKPNNRDSGTLLAAYGDEATHSVQLWDTSTVERLQQLDTQPDAVLDIKSFNINSTDYLTLLTEKYLKICTWTPG